METLEGRMKKLEIITEFNSLTFENKDGSNETLVKINSDGFEYINEQISPTETANEYDFLMKIRDRMPLLKAGSEKKDRLTENDYIQYS